MEFPFSRNQYNATRPSYSFNPLFSSPAPRSIPVSSPSSRSIPVGQPQRSNPSPSPRVVSIPVHFVGLEKTRSAAAVKIQKVFRGFAVRKNVRKIAEIRAEVDEMERRISDSKELIRVDAKERLRVNEMLMSLLFRLDSIRGFDPVVRDCRKAVIRRVIALQDSVDAIVALPDAEEKDDEAREMVDSAGSETAALVVPDSAAGEPVDETPEMHESADSSMENMESIQDGQISPDQSPPQPVEDSHDKSAVADQMAEGHDSDGYALNNIGNQMVPGDVVGTDHCKCRAEAGDEMSNGGTETVENDDLTSRVTKCEEENLTVEKSGRPVEEKEAAFSGVRESDGARQDEGGKKSSDSSCAMMVMDMMGRLVAENCELKDLVMELCERNTLQNRLINSLSQRVEALERTVARRERLRQKKKEAGGGKCSRDQEIRNL